MGVVALLCLLGALAAAGGSGDIETELRGLRQAVRQWSSSELDARQEMPRVQAALAKFEELQRDDRFAALPEQTRVSTLDSCEFLARTLGHHEQAVSYAKRVADSPLCQSPKSGDCFPALASKVVSRLRALGRPEEATEYFRKVMAVTGSRSTLGGDFGPLLQWTSEWQTPSWYIPGLRARRWWPAGASDPPTLAAARAATTEHFNAMQAEVVRLAGRAGRMEEDGGEQRLFELQGDHELVSTGAWTEYLLYDEGRWHEAHCERLPTVCSVLSTLPAIAGIVEGIDEGSVPLRSPGQVTILRMDAGTELGSHCGPRNTRLTAHLPLIVPPQAPDQPEGARPGVRVGEPGGEEGGWRMWEEGELMIFDDSFEHEARWPEPVEPRHGTTARYVLYASLWHPDLGEPELPAERRWEKQKGGGRRKKGGRGKARKKSEL